MTKIIKFENVIGNEFLKNRIGVRFKRFISGDWNKNKTVRRPHGVILSGSPGVGKSYFCEAIIGEFVIDSDILKLKKIDKSIIASKENNSTTAKVNKLFDEIRKNQQWIYILHIEEGDDLFISRRKVSRAHANELTSAWLKNMEGHNAPDNYYILATTNYIERWDSAIIDRMEFVYEIDLPDVIQRKELIERIIVDNHVICNINDEMINQWAKNSKLLTARDFNKIQLRLEDIEFEIHEKDTAALISTVTVSREIAIRCQNKECEINGFKDNWNEDWK